MKVPDFVLTVDAPQGASVRRSLPLDLKVTYTGDKPIEVLSLEGDFLDISFDSPQEWTVRRRLDHRRLQGRLPIVSVKKGSTLSRTVNLQDVFSKVTPGKATLGLTLRIWTDAGKSEQPVVLKATVPLVLAEEDDEAVQRHIDTISRRIVHEHSVDKRIELYRDIMGISSRDVVAVLTRGLTDLEVQSLHDQMRRRAFELADSFDSKGILVRYLAEDGARRDEYFFSMWQKSDVVLSEEEAKVLSNARNPWIRLYALNMNPRARDIHGDVESLDAELADMTSYLDELKKSTASARQ